MTVLKKNKIELLLRGLEPPTKASASSNDTTRASLAFNRKPAPKIYILKVRI